MPACQSRTEIIKLRRTKVRSKNEWSKRSIRDENMQGNRHAGGEGGYGKRLAHLLNDYYVSERD